MDRRTFIQWGAGLTGLSSFLISCRDNRVIPGKIIGANAARGHLLRDKKMGPATSFVKKEVVIIGGGISGLSAARWLRNKGINEVVLLELEDHIGGNAFHGSNHLSAYPWGAHYIPVPNNDLKEYLEFLSECEVIVNTDPGGLPVYNELSLCFDPQERLYINGRWQEGLIPQFGVPSNELQQLDRFLKLMEQYRYARGADGKDAFSIPVDRSSKDSLYTRLDEITMKTWMEQQGFTSSYLQEYINYCCRDDFGTPFHQISAWAGIHYFASRKGKGLNAEHSDVLTWPEGNGFLAENLRRSASDFIITNRVVTHVSAAKDGIKVEYFDPASGEVSGYLADHCILAVPQFVAARLLNDKDRQQLVKERMHYSPWMVANLKIENAEERSGAPLSWDNVLHGSQSLGYVEASHQLVQLDKAQRNLTYYLPLTEEEPAAARKTAQAKTHAQWVKQILDELRIVHPNIDEAVKEVNILLWGHAMAQPLPGMIHGGIRQQLAISPDPRIHFAHTDLAGISIFEEAFYQGITAAQQIVSVKTS
jgi:protoporphyrinogen oxidase